MNPIYPDILVALRPRPRSCHIISHFSFEDITASLNLVVNQLSDYIGGLIRKDKTLWEIIIMLKFFIGSIILCQMKKYEELISMYISSRNYIAQ